MIITSEKSFSMKMFCFFFVGSRSSVIFMVSASPLGLAVKYITLEPGVPMVRSYSLSRVMLVTLNRFMK